MNISRREFIKSSAAMSAAALLSRYVGIDKVFAKNAKGSHPNILLLMTDQQHMPPAYAPNEGAAPGLKEILGFKPLSPDNPFTRFFPGYLRLRQNAVALKTHYTASAACVPSRACIMTGTYTTGVTQTDGIWKSAEDVPWLDPNGTPTIGDWFRALGYSTHYFGKWHVSYPHRSLEPWGFADWNSSAPEPHGGGADNLGVYRDVGFADNAVRFLSQQGKDRSRTKPWFAVGSVVNPHDNGNWPSCWQLPNDQGVVPWAGPSLLIPPQGAKSLPGWDGLVVDLNPDGFPQDNSTLPPTYGESLDSKPRCQYDYSFKQGLAFKSSWNYYDIPSPYPFQTNPAASAWSLGFNQFYYYCQYLADLQLRRILQALDDNGLAENTIVVFLPDHGEVNGAHGGMIQKWHNAYEETIHMPMVVSSPLINQDQQQMRDILQPTSSIDLLPTLLGLAGYDMDELRLGMEAMQGNQDVKPLVGADLSSHIKGENTGPILGPDGKPRLGVFYMSEDMITEIGANPTDVIQGQYDLFLENVDQLISDGYPLAPGTVRQPNNVRALCTGDWKIVKYVDPGKNEPDEWELYCLTADPIEEINLVDFSTGEVRDDVSVPGMTKAELVLKNQQLKDELARQEAAALGNSS